MEIVRWVLLVAAALILGTFAVFGFLEARDRRRAERGAPPVYDHMPRGDNNGR
jgi:hypothetical protein